ncbi:Plasma membrane fusion protein prm1 [Sphaceloma murrayae]|uniref:Plasma membrane fusion protein PRM1 n=1 Tax=Sphaceloma murrayae TaxID=2082308 RepID=A0A2K1QPA7_9PEZI|nr:Plasma membrane fusion protein prm1 [Sphaceloma murrayae]
MANIPNLLVRHFPRFRSMPSAQNQQTSFPAAPPSPSAGGHEMRDYYAAREISRPPLLSSSHPTPYLGLRARLSQVWINRWTILLLLVLIRTLLAIASLDDNLGSAREKALSACTSVENVGSAMASMPHYLSGGVNELTADGIDKAVNGLMHMLTLSVTGVQEMVVFIINLLISTYVCLITFVVAGSLHMAIEVAEKVGDFLNSTAKEVGDDLANVANGFQNTMNGFLNGIDNIGDFFTGKDTPPPKIDLTKQIDRLNNLQLPAAYDEGLMKLNNSIPTFKEVQNFTNNAIRFPFQEVKKLLNESLPTYRMNRTMFPVPQKEQLTFCSDSNGINDFFDDLVNIEQVARKIFIGVLVAAAVLACVPMAYREIRRWRLMQERAALVKKEAVDNMDAVYLVSRPYTSSVGLTLSSKCASPRRKAAIRWSVAYATTVPALFVLSLAVAGLLGCLCQYILLRTIEKEVPGLTNQVGAFADKVVIQLNNASQQWAVGTNDIINATNTKINDDVFGWVNTTTGAMNNTLNTFVDGMMEGLNATFGGTPLYDPVLEVLNCLVLLKVQGISKALTWVSNNAYISFPEMPVDTFSLGALDSMSENGNNSLLATGPASGASDEISDAVLKVTRKLYSAIREEAIISACILIIWFVIVIIGVVRSAFLLLKGGDPSSEGPVPPQYKLDLDGFFPSNGVATSHTPSYEQATTRSIDSDANRYYGQAYTLDRKPIPTFQFDKPASPVIDLPYPPDEKVGMVGVQNVESATHRPDNTRSSSYGNLAVTTPIEPTPQTKIYYTHGSQDPFADPR